MNRISIKYLPTGVSDNRMALVEVMLSNAYGKPHEDDIQRVQRSFMKNLYANLHPKEKASNPKGLLLLNPDAYRDFLEADDAHKAAVAAHAGQITLFNEQQAAILAAPVAHGIDADDILDEPEDLPEAPEVVDPKYGLWHQGNIFNGEDGTIMAMDTAARQKAAAVIAEHYTLRFRCSSSEFSSGTRIEAVP
jgi:hypothetical protein